MIVTLIADNYFGYCKKEVKTQISYAANLFGHAEEEHAGGALAFPSFNLGERVRRAGRCRRRPHARRGARARLGERFDVQPEGYADRQRVSRHRLRAEDAEYRCADRTVTWTEDGGAAARSRCSPDKVYISPSGYKVRMEKHPPRRAGASSARWPRARSATSPAPSPAAARGDQQGLVDAFIVRLRLRRRPREGPGRGRGIFERDYADARMPRPGARRHGAAPDPVARALARLGDQAAHAVAPDYTDEYNAWLERSRSYVASWSSSSSASTARSGATTGASHFSVDIINGRPGNELKLDGRKLVAQLPPRRLRRRRRVADRSSCARTSRRRQGADGGRHHRLGRRAAAACWGLDRRADARFKLVENCEFRLFQRPDDAIHRGFDTQTERDMADPGHLPVQLRAADRARTRGDASTRRSRSTRSPRRCSADQRLRRHREGDGPATSSARPTRGWSTASRRRTRATSSSAPTSPTPRRPLRRRARRAARPADAGRRAGAPPGRRRRSPGGATTRRTRPASAALRSTARSTTRSCPSCSWTSSAP